MSTKKTKSYIHQQTGKPVKFVHDRDNGVTFGYVVEQLADRLKVYAAVSVCSERDNFNRKIGREVVTGRLNCARLNAHYPHHEEFFLSGKLPESGEQWRYFEDAVINQMYHLRTAAHYEEHA